MLIWIEYHEQNQFFCDVEILISLFSFIVKCKILSNYSIVKTFRFA